MSTLRQVTSDNVDLEQDARSFISRRLEHYETGGGALEQSGAITGRIATKARIEVYGVLKEDDKPNEILVLGTIPLEELYPNADAKPLLWSTHIKACISFGEKLLQLQTSEPHFDAQTTAFLGRLLALKEFLGTSSGHDQAISALFAAVSNELKAPLTIAKIRGFVASLGVLKNTIHVSDDTVDRFEDTLDEHGLDFRMAIEESDGGAESSASS